MARKAGKTKVGVYRGENGFGAEFERGVEDLEPGAAKMIIGPTGKPVFIRRLPSGEIVILHKTFFGYRREEL